MGIWDSVKNGANNFAQLNTLQNKIKNNEQLNDQEIQEFEKLAKRAIQEDMIKSPNKYFKATTAYGNIKIDEVKKLFSINFTTYSFEELNSYELMENGSSISSGGLGIGRALVGGVLLGGVGAILGGVTKKRRQTNVVESLKILVTFKNRKPVSTTIDFITKKQNKDKKYEKILATAQETLAGFDYITNQLEGNKHEELIGVMSNDVSVDSVADELRKFKNLVDDGIISEEEFEIKKAELLK